VNHDAATYATNFWVRLSGEAMSHASVAAEPSMDEILEKIQRTIATDGKEESQLADPIRPSTETLGKH
jgi:hypothetical protein